MTAYESIYLLNSLIGNPEYHPDTDEFFNSVANQIGLVREELDEALDEAVDQDLEKLTKEVADVMVTSIGLLQKLQRSGVPIDEVLDRICEANLMKFHRDPDEANKTVEYYSGKGVETFVRAITMTDGTEYFAVIRKTDDKMLKPYNFVGATTEGLFEECLKPWESGE